MLVLNTYSSALYGHYDFHEHTEIFFFWRFADRASQYTYLSN